MGARYSHTILARDPHAPELPPTITSDKRGPLVREWDVRECVRGSCFLGTEHFEFVPVRPLQLVKTFKATTVRVRARSGS